MLVTLIAGYDIAHSQDPVEVKAEPIEETIITVGEVTTKPYEPRVPDDIEGYIKYKFGKVEGEKAIFMLKECENRTLNPKAINWNSNGTWDFGTMQINQIHGYSQEQLSDFKFNIDVAYEIYKRAGYSFSPWTCSYIIGHKSFWQ